MFESARFKLTAWYLCIIMLISIFFSVAFYHATTREIQILMDRIEYEQHREDNLPREFIQPRPFPRFSLEDLQAVKDRIKLNLIFLNGFIFVVAGAAGYFLAGKTLRPIKVMVDEQNQFISSASHELRTPIATMRAEMESNLMEKKISDKTARKLISSNLEEITTLQELTNGLLRLAHVHNSTGDQNIAVISIQEVIKNAIKKVQPLAKKKHIQIVSDLSKIKLEGDKNALREVFVILLDNAIKYSPQKSKVTIAVHKSKDAIIAEVKDQGIGIAQEDLPKIFERFYRANKARNEEGYGLGLSIAQKIVHLHSGTITVTSAEKKGTTFIVAIPTKSSLKN